MRPHHHPNIELTFCLKGELTYNIEGCGTVSLSEGSCIIMPANTIHVLQGGTDMPGFRMGMHICSTINPNRCRYRLFSNNDYANLYAKLTAMTSHPFRMSRRTLDTAKELASHIGEQRPNRLELGKIRVLSTLLLYRVIDTLADPPIAIGTTLMDEAINFIETHFADKFSIDTLVQKMGYGRTRLFAMFKNHTGLTPNVYSIRHRLRIAQSLLKQGKSIPEVAKAVGFSSTAYFRTVLKKYTGSN